MIGKVVPGRLWAAMAVIKFKVKNRYFLKQKFKELHGYDLNLNNPQTFNEKIQFRKKYGNKKFMAMIADKYKAREYVKERIGEQHIIPLLGVYNKVSVADLKKLPNQFVIKTNRGSGPDHIEIVKNKSGTDLEKLVKKMNRSVKLKFGKLTGEDFYDLIEPKIIAEELLLNDGNVPEDYKFHCFKSENKVYIQVDSGRFVDHKRNIYDENFDFVDMKLDSKFDHFNSHLRPEKFEKMKELAQKISEEFDYIRADFYLVGDKVCFGELTQTHGGGFEDFKPLIWDKKWGDLWKIDFSNEKLYTKKNPLNKKVDNLKSNFQNMEAI